MNMPTWNNDHVGPFQNSPFDSGIVYTPTPSVAYARTQLFSSGNRTKIFPTVTEHVNVNDFSGFLPTVTNVSSLPIIAEQDDTPATAVTYVVMPTHTHTTPSVRPRVREPVQITPNIQNPSCNHAHVSCNETPVNAGIGDSMSTGAST